MCGFLCQINRKGKAININKNLLKHRGPDFTKECAYESISIRHWRLAIVDLTDSSNQPYENEDYLFAYNGELYNYKKISNDFFGKPYESDTNLFFDLVTNNFEKKIRNCSGFYSYLLLNKNEKKISGGRDLLGKKPLYYFIDDDVALFSSEESAIFKIIKNRIKFNKKSFLSYLIFKDIFFGNTCFKGIREIPPGSNFNFDYKNWKFNLDFDWNEYYSKSFVKRLDLKMLDNPNQAGSSFNKDNIFNTINSSIKARFSCDVDLQLALSGGIDSTLIAYLTSIDKSLKDRLINSLTIKFNHKLDESQRASKLAEYLNIPNQSIDFSCFDFLDLLKKCIKFQGSMLGHPHCLAYYILCKKASDKGKVLLTGEGADEIFFGYSHYKLFDDSFAFRPFLDVNNFFLTGNSNFLEIFSDEFSLRKKAISNIEISRDLELKTHLLSLLRRNDRMSMRNSLEIRAPFLDLNLIYNILEIVKIYQTDFFQKKSLESYLINKIPMYDRLPEKIGFYVPYDQWYENNKNKKEVKNLINISLSFLEKELNLKVKNTNIDNPRLSWLLINIGVFLKEFFDNE